MREKDFKLIHQQNSLKQSMSLDLTQFQSNVDTVELAL